MDETPQRRFININPDTDPRSSPPRADHRTELNNWLQVNGGPGRLDWTSFRGGPENNPTWVVICLSASPCEPSLSVGMSSNPAP